MNRKSSKDKSFSYPVHVQGLSSKPVLIHIEAGPDELQDMQERWGLIGLGPVTADVEVSRWKRDGVRIKGHVRADIVQSCIVTLEPIESGIDERFEALFVPENSKLARYDTDENGEMVFDPEGPDAPETFTGDTIDVGTVCEEFIVLAIDPYPRKEGAKFETETENDIAPEEKSSPFAKLEGWKPAKRD
jgi:uncharacterized metal-binding protein YceD (DUF177 family)